MHPHENVEIITYVINGELTHKDSLGNIETLTRGDIQYLSAGDGIYHSEYNFHKFENLRLLQMWIVPPQKGLSKLYGSHKFLNEDRKNKLLNIVSSNKGLSPIKIYQDVNFFASELEKEKTLGGLARQISQIPEKTRIAHFPKYLEKRAEKLHDLF